MPTKCLGGLMFLALALLPACYAFGNDRPTLFGALSNAYGSPYAQRYTEPVEESEIWDSEDAAWDPELAADAEPSFGPRLNVNGIFGDRRGVIGNDYSVGAFLPWHILPDQHIAFLIVRGTATDAGNFAGSLGLGQRLYLPGVDHIVGLSGWCDVDDAHRQTYVRAGGQVEVIGPRLEFRGGADLIVGDTLWTDVAAARTQTLFRGNRINIQFINQIEQAYDQAYVELGGPVPGLGRRGVKAFAGAYYLSSSSAEGAVGWQARTSAAVTDNIQIGAQLTQDDPFGMNAAAYVSLSIPTGGLRQTFRSSRVLVRGQSVDETTSTSQDNTVVTQLASDVTRSFRIPVWSGQSVETVAAVDPGNGQHFSVIHVDPQAASQGDGSFERPFNSLEAARLANNAQTAIIHVVASGTATNLQVTAPLQLFDNQRLLASSVSHLFTTAQGTFPLPGFTGGLPPVLTNSQLAASAVVQMVDNTEVSGFQIDGSGRHIGLRGNIQGFNINRNDVVNATNGVQLANADGFGLIENNTFRNNSGDGLNITVTNGESLNLIVADNTGSGNGDDGVDVSVTGSYLTALFEGNKLGDNVDHGLVITSSSTATVSASLQRNELGQSTGGIGGNGGAGFRFDADSGFADLTIGGDNAEDGNIALGNTGESFSFDLRGIAIAIVDERNNTAPPPINASNSFNIVIEFGGGLTAGQQAMFAAAEQRWESIIIGDLANVGAIDDIHIFASADAIDGLGGTLAEALPNGLRTNSYLPFQGEMRFDTADLVALQVSGELEDVILHEMAHVLGFGSLWQRKGLISGYGSADPRFTGAQATAEFNTQFGMTANGVPLETTGGPGTAMNHWLETVYGDELMTGFISGAVRPLSRTTIAQFSDLGYITDITQADP